MKNFRGMRVITFAIDISEHKQAEEALKSSNERLNIIFESAPDTFYLNNFEGIFIDGNRASEKLLGYKREELVGKTFVEAGILSLQDTEQAVKILMRNINGESTGPDEYDLIRKDGSTVSVEILTHPVVIGGEGMVLGIARDITDRKLTEEKIKEQIKFQTSILESLTHPFYVINIHDYSIEIANSASGFNPDIDKLTCYSITHRSDKPCSGSEHPCPIEIVKKTKGSTFVEHIHYDKDGNERNVEVHCFPIFDKKRNIIQVIEYSLDITERKQAQKAMRTSEVKFHSLFSEMEEGVYLHEIIYNQKGEAVNYRILETNPASEKHLNIKLEDAKDKLATELYGTEEAPYLDIYAKVAKTGIPFNFEEYFPPLKKYFHISIYSPEKGKFATVFSDITERKQAEENMKNRNEELELFNKVAVGRELKMIELKKEINEMLIELNKEKKYEIAD